MWPDRISTRSKTRDLVPVHRVAHAAGPRFSSNYYGQLGLLIAALKYRGFGVQTAGNTESRTFQCAINDGNPSGGLGEPALQSWLIFMKNQWILMAGYKKRQFWSLKM